MSNRLTSFISYSWDSPEHQEWVLKLATDLMKVYGINVLLDQFELSAGRELTLFMESSVEKSDKVLVIMTPNYQKKANERKGGVGFEYSMISQGLFATQTENGKFVPILRNGDLSSSCPSYLKGLVYHDMRDSTEYDSALYQLSRILYEKPEKVKPELGAVPDFDSIGLDPLLYQMEKLSTQTSLNNALDQKLNSGDSLQVIHDEVAQLFQLIETKAKLYNESPSVDIEFIIERGRNNSLLITSNKYSVVFNFEQRYSNSSTGAHLNIALWAGRVTFRSDRFYFPGEGPSRLTDKNWNFNLDVDGNPVWNYGNQTVKSESLAHDAFAYIIDKIRENRSKNFR